MWHKAMFSLVQQLNGISFIFSCFFFKLISSRIWNCSFLIIFIYDFGDISEDLSYFFNQLYPDIRK